MIENELLELLRTRIAVYKAGVASGIWDDINALGAKDMMVYIFPKSGIIAYYNLILEYMRKKHEDLPEGVFNLFKMPVQAEKELMDYLKKHRDMELESLVANPRDYLNQRDTILTDHSNSPVRIGSTRETSVDDLLRLCASHYCYLFDNHVESFPYFD